jgi:hypothetical protein
VEILPTLMPAAPSALELAEAAFSSEPLARARRLAEWVGRGKTLTARRVLRPADATQACLALGIDFDSPRLRSALDVDDLMQDWAIAVVTGVIVIDGRRARRAGPEEIASPASDPEAILDAWSGAAAFMLDLADEDPCAGCLTALHELHAATEPVDLEQLASAVATVLESGELDGMPCPGCGQIHDPNDEVGPFDLLDDEDWPEDGDLDWDAEDDEDPAEHVAATVTGLLAFNAADIVDAKVRLTPLGSFLAEKVFQGRLVTAASDVSALITAIGDSPLSFGRILARPWLATRSVPAAVSELLTFAESAGGFSRMTAVAFAGELGIEAVDAWRKWEDQPGFGAYARLWLREHDEPVQEDPADEPWLAADGLSTLVEGLADTVPLNVLRETLAEQIGEELAEAADLVLTSGHPRAEYVATWLRNAHESGAEL